MFCYINVYMLNVHLHVYVNNEDVELKEKPWNSPFSNVLLHDVVPA